MDADSLEDFSRAWARRAHVWAQSKFTAETRSHREKFGIAVLESKRPSSENSGSSVAKFPGGKRRAIFMLSFPRSSTGKRGRPQLLHKGIAFSCCRPRETAGE